MEGTMMNRTKLAGFVAAALLVVAGWVPNVKAAEELTIDQQVALIRSLSEAQRTATMAANVVLTEAEGAKFWPLYRDYRNEVAKINDKMIALLKDYADNFEAMTDAKAKAYISDYLSVQKARLDLKSQYVGKFDKVLPPIKTARVLQIETKLDSMVDAGLAKTIPLVTAPTPPAPAAAQ
jgi:hypothetical protein